MIPAVAILTEVINTNFQDPIVTGHLFFGQYALVLTHS